MGPLSFIEKIQMVGNLIVSSPLYSVALLVILFLLYLFITTNGSNKKESRKAYMLIYLAACVFFAFQYGNSFLSLIDYTVNQMFITYYFPNIVIYLLILVVTNVILWKTIFSDTIAKSVKLLNSSIFGIIIYLFILVLSLINELKLDVFNLEELYSSTQVRSIMELSMMVFTVWVCVLVVYKLIRKHQRKKNVFRVDEVSGYEIVNHRNYDSCINMNSRTKFIEPVVETVKQENHPELFTLYEYKMLSKILKEEKVKKTEPAPLSELNKLYSSIQM